MGRPAVGQPAAAAEGAEGRSLCLGASAHQRAPDFIPLLFAACPVQTPGARPASITTSSPPRCPALPRLPAAAAAVLLACATLPHCHCLPASQLLPSCISLAALAPCLPLHPPCCHPDPTRPSAQVDYFSWANPEFLSVFAAGNDGDKMTGVGSSGAPWAGACQPAALRRSGVVFVGSAPGRSLAAVARLWQPTEVAAAASAAVACLSVCRGGVGDQPRQRQELPQRGRHPGV